MIAIDQNFVLERPLRRGIQEQYGGSHVEAAVLAAHRAERSDSRTTSTSFDVSARRSVTGDASERPEKPASFVSQGRNAGTTSPAHPPDERHTSREPLLLQTIAFVGESDGGPLAARTDSLVHQLSSGMTNSSLSMPSFVLRHKGSSSSVSKTGSFQQQQQQQPYSAPMSFLGRDVSTNERVIIYVHRDACNRGVVNAMGKILRRLVDGTDGRYLPGVPRLLYCDWEEKAFHCLIVPALGPTLQQLILYCGGRLCRKSVIMLGIQLLELLRHCHSKDVLINDLSPRTLRFGSSVLDSQQVYLASLLFSCTRQHQPMNAPISTAAVALTNRIVGTALDASGRSNAAPQEHSSMDSSGVASQSNDPNRSFEAASVSTAHRPSVVAARDTQYQMLRSNNLLFCSSRYPFRRSLGVADDVESVAYILAYCSLGKLPWWALVDEKTGRLTRAISNEEGWSSSSTPAPSQGNAVRQLFQQKEQFVLHSSKTKLLGPVKLLLSHLHRFKDEQPDLDTVVPDARSHSPNPGDSLINFNVPNGVGGSPTAAAAAVAETGIQKTFRVLIAQFRRYLVEHGEVEDYRFDWNE